MSGAPAEPAAPASAARRAPFWRGATDAIALAAWTVAGVLGAALALLPAVLEGRPHGRRARRQPVDASPRLVVNGGPPPDAAEAPQAREAFPG